MAAWRESGFLSRQNHWLGSFLYNQIEYAGLKLWVNKILNYFSADSQLLLASIGVDEQNKTGTTLL